MTRLAAVIRVVLMAAFSSVFARVLIGVLVVGALSEYCPQGLWVLGGALVTDLIAGVIDERSQGKTRPGRGSSHTTGSDRESPATSRRRPAPQGLEIASAAHI